MLEETIISGILLHDIGKVVQRAKGIGYKAHTEEGISFLREVLEGLSGDEKDIIMQIVGKHHDNVSRDDILERNAVELAKLSDQLSASERRLIKEDLNKFRKIWVSMLSIFSEITGIVDNSKVESYFIDGVFPLEIYPDKIEFYFPTLKENEIFHDNEIDGNFKNKVIVGYRQILDRLKKDIKRLISMNLFREDTLLIVLEKALTFVPSDTAYAPKVNAYPDISLFDHVRVAAMIAQAILNYIKEEYGTSIENKEFADIVSKVKNGSNKVFLIIKGDITGVQKFIYSVGTKWALKLLRARSSYLELLAEDIIAEILSRLNLGRSNLVYSGGGHFIILAQNSKKAKKALTEIENCINEWFFKEFKGQLSLVLVWEEVSYRDFLTDDPKECPNIVKVLEDAIPYKIENKKLRKFIDIFAKNPEKTVLPDDYEQCFSCRLHYPKNKLKSLEEIKKKLGEEVEERDKDRFLCSFCEQLVEVGRWLIFSDLFIRISDKEKLKELIDRRAFSEIDIVYIEMPFSYFLFPKVWKIEEHRNKYIESLVNHFKAIAKLLKNYDILGGILYLKNMLDIPSAFENINEFLWYYHIVFFPVGDYVVLGKRNEVASIDEIVKKTHGPEWAAALRMDVDRLGKIFMRGLKGEICRYTFSRYATLSRFLNYFFKLIVPFALKHGIHNFEEVLAKYNFEILRDLSTVKQLLPANLGVINGKHEIVVVYSGGDDVFLVGAWDHVINASLIIESLFKAFTANNPNISISAGINLFAPKYPVLKASIEAGELEEKSKGAGRNALTIFNQIFNWREFREIWQKIVDLKIIAQENGKIILNMISKAFLRVLLYSLQDIQEDIKEFDGLVPIDKVYTIIYHLGRRLNTIKGDERKRFENFVLYLKEFLFNLPNINEKLSALIAILMLIDLLTRS